MRNPSKQTTTAAPSTTTKTPCCSKIGIKRGPWTPEEDELLANYINKEGEGRWRTLPKRAGLLRCGKSCRLRWMNYLRPSVKRGQIAPDEEDLILRLHRLLGNRRGHTYIEDNGNLLRLQYADYKASMLIIKEGEIVLGHPFFDAKLYTCENPRNKNCPFEKELFSRNPFEPFWRNALSYDYTMIEWGHENQFRGKEKGRKMCIKKK